MNEPMMMPSPDNTNDSSKVRLDASAAERL
jgi:hypothetical protein